MYFGGQKRGFTLQHVPHILRFMCIFSVYCSVLNYIANLSGQNPTKTKLPQNCPSKIRQEQKIGKFATMNGFLNRPKRFGRKDLVEEKVETSNILI